MATVSLEPIEPTPGRIVLERIEPTPGLNRQPGQQVVIEPGNEDAMPNFNHPGSPFAMTPVHLCHLVFLSLLYLKLEDRFSQSWMYVFLVLLVPDGGILIFRSGEIYRGMHPTESTPAPQQELHNMLRTACSMIDTVGSLITKIFIAIALNNGAASHDVVIVLLPLWISIGISGFARCVLPPPNRIRQTEGALKGYRLSQMMIGFAHLVFRGVQPLLIALRLDGVLGASWFDIFVPAWILLLCFGLLATALFNCAPFFTLAANRGSEMYQQIKYLLILYSLQFYLFTATIFFFLYQLAKRLDCQAEKGPTSTCGISLIQLLLPLMVLYFVLLFLNPLVIKNSARYQSHVQEMYAQIFDPSAAVHAEMGENPLSPLTGPIWLARQGNSLYRRPSGIVLKQLQKLVEPSALAGGTGGPPHTQLDIESKGEDGKIAGNGREEKTAEGHKTFGSQVLLDLSKLGEQATVLPITGNSIEEGVALSLSQVKCCVCLTNECNGVLMECGHASVCYSCGQVVAKRKPGLCPVCRTKITHVLRIDTEGCQKVGDSCYVIAREGFVVTDPEETKIPEEEPSSQHHENSPSNGDQGHNSISHGEGPEGSSVDPSSVRDQGTTPPAVSSPERDSDCQGQDSSGQLGAKTSSTTPNDDCFDCSDGVGSTRSLTADGNRAGEEKGCKGACTEGDGALKDGKQQVSCGSDEEAEEEGRSSSVEPTVVREFDESSLC